MLTVTVSTRSGLAAHSHWLTDVRARYWLTCQKWHAYGCLPSYLLDGTMQRAGRAIWCLLCLATVTHVTPAVCAVEHCLISVNTAVCFTRLPSPITADYYRYSVCISIGGDMQTDISYSLILQRCEYSLIDIQYRSNTSTGYLYWYLRCTYVPFSNTGTGTWDSGTSTGTCTSCTISTCQFLANFRKKSSKLLYFMAGHA